eukprot:g13073.t1
MDRQMLAREGCVLVDFEDLFWFEDEESGTLFSYKCTVGVATEIETRLQLLVKRRSRGAVQHTQTLRQQRAKNGKTPAQRSSSTHDGEEAIAAPNVGSEAGGEAEARMTVQEAVERQGGAGPTTPNGEVDVLMHGVLDVPEDLWAAYAGGSKLEVEHNDQMRGTLSFLARRFNKEVSTMAAEGGLGPTIGVLAVSFGSCCTANLAAAVQGLGGRLEVDVGDGEQLYRTRWSVLRTGAKARLPVSVEMGALLTSDKTDTSTDNEKAIEMAITATRGMKSEFTSEGSIFSALKQELGSDLIGQFALNDETGGPINHQTVYVTMPHLVKELKGRKVGRAVLEDPSKAKYIFAQGKDKGSLFDLIDEGCTPSTTFPSTTKGVWDRPTYSGDEVTRTRSQSRSG